MKKKFFNQKLLVGLAVVGLTGFLTVRSVMAQNVSLKNLSGEAVTMQEMKGKITVLAIGATWLPLSKDQAVIVNKLTKTFAKKDVAIYFVATDSDVQKSRNFATDDQIGVFGTKNKLTAPILRDTTGATLKKFGLDQIPAFVILDATGKVIEKIDGIDPDPEADLAEQLTNTLNGLLN